MLTGACNPTTCPIPSAGPLSQSYPVYNSLSTRGVPTGMVIYPGEGHGIVGLGLIAYHFFRISQPQRRGAVLFLASMLIGALQSNFLFFFKWHAPFPFSGFDRPRNKKDSLRRTLAWFLAFLPPNNAAAAAASEDGKLDAAAPTA